MGSFGRQVVAIAALVSAVGYGTWLWARHTLEIGAGWSDGSTSYGSVEGERIRYAVWESPVPLAGEVNGDAAERRPAVSPDGRFLVFCVGEPGLNRELWISELGSTGPAEPRPLTGLNSPFDDIAPAFGADALYFATDRSRTGGLDLWRAPYADGVFGSPEPLARGVNTAADETDPFPVADASPGSSASPGSTAPRETLLFSSNRARGARVDFDLYLASPKPSGSEPGSAPDSIGAAYAVSPLPSLASPFDEREPALTADGRTLYFASDRQGSRGGFDLYRSFLEDGRWLAPRPLSGVNGVTSERAPLPSADGFSLFFDRSTRDDDADLWSARSRELFRVPAPPIGWRELALLCALLLLAIFALLAQRWSSLEVLYRCFLISLVAHLLLLWLLREVYPESEPVALGGDERAFRVRLAASPSGAASSERERAGQLERAPSERLSAGPVSFASPAPAAEAPTPTPNELALASPAAPAEAPSPARGSLEPSERAAPPTDGGLAESSLLDREPREGPSASAAPTLALDAAPSAASPAPIPQRQPERARGTRGERAEDDGRPPAAIAALPVALERRTEAGLGAPLQTLPLVREIDGARVAGSVSARTPQESFEASAAERPELELGDPSAERAPARSQPALSDAAHPARARGAAGAPQTLPSASPAEGLALPSAAVASREPRSSAAPSRLALDWEAPEQASSVAEPELRAQRPEPVVARREAASAERFDALGDRPTAATVSRSRPGPIAQPVLAPQPARERDDPLPSELELALALPSRPTSTVPMDRSPVEPPERIAVETPYQNRFGDEKLRALEEFGGGEETERAVAMGLAYLASIQSRRGAWGSRSDHDEKYGDVRIGKTALALLAFLGAGHTPRSATEHSAATQRAVDFLASSQERGSGHFGDSSAYGHGIATYALAECYALTREPLLEPVLRRAVRHILAYQSDVRDRRHHGGWGYYDADGEGYRGDRWPRVSVSAWQVMALESARLGGFDVPREAFDAARGLPLLGLGRAARSVPLQPRPGPPALGLPDPAGLDAGRPVRVIAPGGRHLATGPGPGSPLRPTPSSPRLRRRRRGRVRVPGARQPLLLVLRLAGHVPRGGQRLATLERGDEGHAVAGAGAGTALGSRSRSTPRSAETTTRTAPTQPRCAS